MRLRHAFILGDELGGGADGVCYRGTTTDARRAVCIKLVDRRDEAALAALRREHDAATLVRHPALPEVRALGPWDEERVALVREYVAGSPLDHALARSEVTERNQVVARVAAALAALHAVGLVHGDLKPSHIVVRHDGAPAFIDLGFSHLGLGEPPRRAGTPAFAAPELLAGEPVSTAADVYAFAVSVIGSLTGGAGHTAPDLTALSQLVEPELARALLAACSARPEHRPTADVVAALAGATSEPARRNMLIAEQPPPASSRRVVPVALGSQAAAALRADGVARGMSCLTLTCDADGWMDELARSLSAEVANVSSLEARVVLLLDALARASADAPLVLTLEHERATLRDDVAAFVKAAAGERDIAGASELSGTWAVAYVAPDAAPERATVARLRRMVESRSVMRAIADATLETLAAAVGDDLDAADDAIVQLARGDALPAVVDALAARRSTELALGAEEAALMAALSAEPDGLTEDALAAVTDVQRAAIAGTLAGLVHKRLAARKETPTGTIWTARQPASQKSADAHALERRLATYFAAHDEPLRAAAHALRAGAWDEPAATLLAAARTATSATRACRILEPLVAVALERPTARHVPLLREAVLLHEGAGELARVIALHDALVRAGADDAVMRIKALDAAVRLGAYDVAARLAESPEHKEAQAFMVLRARLALHRGDLAGAKRLVRKAARLASDAATRAEVEHVRGLLAFYGGRLSAARRYLARASRAVDVVRDPAAAASIASSRGLVAHKAGKLARAMRYYARSRRLTRRAGDVTRLPTRVLNLGTAAQDAHDLQAAHAAYVEAATMAARVGSDRDRVRVGYNLANLGIQMGALAAAARWLDLAIPIADTRGMRVESARLRLLQGEIGLANEDIAQTRAALARFAEYQGERDSQLAQHAALVHAKLALLEGDILRARLAMNELTHDDPEVWLVAARIDLRDGRAAKAREHADKLMGGSPLLEWQAAVLIAETAELAGDDEALDDAVATARVAYRRALKTLPEAFRGDYQRVPSIARELARMSSLWAKARGSGGSSMLDRVLRVNRKLNECTALDELLTAILDEVVALTAAERSLALVTREGGLRIVAERSLSQGGDAVFSQGLAEQVIATGKAVVTSDAMADERFMQQRSVRDLRMRSIACVPLRIDGTVRGAIYIDHRARESAFDVDAVTVLTAFAEQAALALKSAEMRLALLEERRQLELARSNLVVENEALHSSLTRTSEELERTKLHLTAVGDDDALRAKFAQFVARSRGMLDALDKVQRLASVPLPIFVHGESGAGKELIARALHTHGSRAAKSFVAVNCAAIPNELLESELFGVKRGAYTGAVADRPGLFRVADGGTLFLDEVGDMAGAMQVKLLRVLEEGTFRAVGATDEQSTDVRVVCASHKSLADLVATGRFREDLYYRLAGAIIELPPLRERAEDIPELTRVLLARAARDFGNDVPKVKREVLDALQAYAWPGNVRELDNELRRALALADDELRLGHFSKAVRAAARGLSLPTSKAKRYRDAVSNFEKTFLAEALASHDNDPVRAARAIGISRSGIYAKLKQHRLGEVE